MSGRVLSAAALALSASTGAAQGTGFYGLSGVRDIHGEVSEMQRTLASSVNPARPLLPR